MAEEHDRTAGGMYAIIPCDVLYDAQLRPVAKLLYGEVVRLANAKGYCWASNAALAEVCGVAKGTVSELVSQLQKRGHIHVQMLRRNGARGDIVERRIYAARVLGMPSEGIPKNPDTSTEKTAEGMRKNPNVYNRLKNTREKNTPIVPTEVTEIITEYVGSDSDLREALEGLLENRTIANHKPVKTVRCIRGILRELDKLSGGDRLLKIRLLEKATVSNWLSVFPLKADELPQGSSPKVREEEGVRYV